MPSESDPKPLDVHTEDLELLHDHAIALTRVGEMIVSTIKLRESLRGVDTLITMMSDLIGYNERADLGAEGDYESMVFDYEAWESHGGIREFDFRRYQTEEEARQGHQELVDKWKTMPAIKQDEDYT